VRDALTCTYVARCRGARGAWWPRCVRVGARAARSAALARPRSILVRLFLNRTFAHKVPGEPGW